MGMTSIYCEPLKRKPLGKGNVICRKCHSEYDPKIQYISVSPVKDTTGRYNYLGDIKENTCPLCGEPTPKEIS